MRMVYIWLLCTSIASIILCNEQENSFPEPVQEPEDVQEEAEIIVEQKPLVTIDTMDLGEPQGNWLFKRHWWKRANKIYDRITTLVNEIFELRSRFARDRNTLERDLFDPFYLTVGIKQGELRALISYLIEQLEQEDTSGISDHERLLLGKLKDHQELIVQLNADTQDIVTVDQKVDTAITALLEQLNLVRAYKQQAWEDFKAIERELSDQRARELVFEMRALEKNIKDIKAYLLGSFTEFFDSLLARASQEVERIQQIIRELKDKGIDLKKEAQLLEFTDTEAPEAVPETQGFFAWLWSWITGLFSSLFGAIRNLFR